jgi:hypothetical protein
VIQAGSIDRVFQVLSNVTVIFKNLTITGGTARDNGSAGASVLSTDALGGGILSVGGNVTLDHVTVGKNQALGANGLLGGAGRAALGGGVFADGGTLKLQNASVVTLNFVRGGAGANGFVPGAPRREGRQRVRRRDLQRNLPRRRRRCHPEQRRRRRRGRQRRQWRGRRPRAPTPRRARP